MIEYDTIYDISVTNGKESIAYPGDPGFEFVMEAQLKNGDVVNLSKLSMSSHCGTHLDLPLHFINDTPSMHEYQIDNFIMPAVVIGIDNAKAITLADIKNEPIKENYAVLFKTNNSISGMNITGKFSEEYVYLTGEAAEYCAMQGVKLVGIDYITVDKYGDDTFPAHMTLLRNNIFILESINLKTIVPGMYTLTCFPLKILNGEASPVRAVLLK